MCWSVEGDTHSANGMYHVCIEKSSLSRETLVYAGRTVSASGFSPHVSPTVAAHTAVRLWPGYSDCCKAAK